MEKIFTLFVYAALAYNVLRVLWTVLKGSVKILWYIALVVATLYLFSTIAKIIS